MKRLERREQWRRDRKSVFTGFDRSVAVPAWDLELINDAMGNIASVMHGLNRIQERIGEAMGIPMQIMSPRAYALLQEHLAQVERANVRKRLRRELTNALWRAR